MRRTLLLFFLLILLGAAFVGCGDSKKPVVPTPANAFAFLQEVPFQGATFTPMLGQYVMTNGTMYFQTAAATDMSSGLPIAEDFGSFYLSRAGDKVAFDMWGGLDTVLVDQWDIYVANSDGSGITQITNDAYADFYPQLSPDGAKVMYRSQREVDSVLTDLIVVRSVTNPLASEQVLPLPLGAYGVYDATFSPDGTQIAVEAAGYNDIDGDFDGLVLMNADGSNPVLLTNPFAACDCWDGYPAFTPDGSQIVFTGYTNTQSGATYDVYATNTDGTGTALLTDGVGWNVDPLVIRVAGMADQIIFYSDRDNLNATASTGFELYSMNLDGSGLGRLTDNGLFDGFNQDWFAPQGTAKAAIFGGRSKHSHRLPGQRNAPRPMLGLKW